MCSNNGIFCFFFSVGKRTQCTIGPYVLNQGYVDRSCIARVHFSTNCLVRNVIIIIVSELIMISHELIAEGFRIYESD